MAELPPIKKPPKLSSKGLGFFFAPKKSQLKWIFENFTNCAATFIISMFIIVRIR